MRLSGVCLVVALAAVLATSCGSTHSKGQTTTTAKNTFSPRAEAICAKYRARIRALPPLKKGLAGIPAYVNRALPIIESTFSRLHALTPPAFQTNGVKIWLQTGHVLVAELKSLRSAAQRGDRREVHRISVVLARNNRNARAYAQALGLFQCSGAGA